MFKNNVNELKSLSTVETTFGVAGHIVYIYGAVRKHIALRHENNRIIVVVTRYYVHSVYADVYLYRFVLCISVLFSTFVGRSRGRRMTILSTKRRYGIRKLPKSFLNPDRVIRKDALSTRHPGTSSLAFLPVVTTVTRRAALSMAERGDR